MCETLEEGNPEELEAQSGDAQALPMDEDKKETSTLQEGAAPAGGQESVQEAPPSPAEKRQEEEREKDDKVVQMRNLFSQTEDRESNEGFAQILRDLFDIEHVSGGIHIHNTSDSNSEIVNSEKINPATLRQEQSLYIRYPDFERHVEIVENQSVCVLAGKEGIGREFTARMLLFHLQEPPDIFRVISSDTGWLREHRFSSDHNIGYIVRCDWNSQMVNTLNNVADQMEGTGCKLLLICGLVSPANDSGRFSVITLQEAIYGYRDVYTAQFTLHAADVSAQQREACLTEVFPRVESKITSVEQAARYAEKTIALLMENKDFSQIVERFLAENPFKTASEFADKIFYLTAALLEGCPVEETMQAFPKLLRLLSHDRDADIESLQRFDLLSESERLAKFHLVICEKTVVREYGKVVQKCLEYADRSRGDAVLSYVLREYSSWSEGLLRWLMDWREKRDLQSNLLNKRLEVFLYYDFDNTMRYLVARAKAQRRYIWLAEVFNFGACRHISEPTEQNLRYFSHILSYIHYCARSDNDKQNTIAMYTYGMGLGVQVPKRALPDMFELLEQKLRNLDHLDVLYDYYRSFGYLFLNSSGALATAILQWLQKLVERNNKQKSLIQFMFLMMMKMTDGSAQRDGQSLHFLRLYHQNSKIRSLLLQFWRSALNDYDAQELAKAILGSEYRRAKVTKIDWIIQFLNDLYNASPTPIEKKRLKAFMESWKKGKYLLTIGQ